MASSPPKKRKSRHFSEGDKELILNIFKTFNSENPTESKTRKVEFTATAAGVSVASVYNILREHETHHELHPPKKYHRQRGVLDSISDVDKDTIRGIVRRLFLTNESPTLNEILSAINDNDKVPNFKRSTLAKLLKEIGFCYNRGHSIDSIVKVEEERIHPYSTIKEEQEEITAWEQGSYKMSDKEDENHEDKKEHMCPICFKQIPTDEIEVHANKCLFLHSDSTPQKRKRSPPRKMSPVSKPRSPRGSPSLTNKTRQFSALPVNRTKPGASDTKTFNPAPNASSSSTEMEFVDVEEHHSIKDLSFVVPLAKQAAPKRLDDFFGQNHILGKNTVLRTLLEKGEIPNMIIWGPPGCGKTSLGSVINEICKSNPKKLKFTSLCAANCGVKDVQNIVSAAKLESKFGRRTILFMDEVHRFNKKQQDTFLLHVERGDITLIGATTENPSFSINSALLSRCRVIVMEKLKTDELLGILERAVRGMRVEIIDDENNGLSNHIFGLAMKRSALQWLADVSDGDARIALSNLQLVFQHNSSEMDKIVTIEDIQEGIKKSHLLYDRKGEEHYNVISAMHKSIRGSDPNAALYWTTRMIVSGEDPLFIARRMVRAASEDIGNADPNALQLAVSTMQGCQLLGMPEADVLLAQCAIYLARAPKSREADSALAAAKDVINNCKGVQPSVPMHIRNAPTKLMKELGYGRLAPGAKRSFMPSGLENVNFFK